MATLNIGGQRVKVGDEFLSLSPEQQSATVEEIAASLPKMQQPAPDDHGRARRDAMSIPEKIASPITEYPTVYAEMNKEARDQMARGAGQLREAVSEAKPIYEPGGPESLWKGVKGAGNVAGGALGYLFSPINAAFRTQVGNPVEDLTGIPREYTEFASQLAAPGVGMGRMPAVPGAPVNPANFRPASSLPEAVPAAPPVVAAADRLSDVAGPVNVPRALASDNITVQRVGQGIRNIPIIGDAIPRATAGLTDELGGAVRTVADQYGAGSGPNVARRIGQSIEGQALAESRAATDAARASDDAVTAAWQGAHDNTMRQIGQAETRSLDQARAAVGDMSPQDMGEALIARLRAGEQEARATKERLYNLAGQSEGSINAEAVGQVRGRVAQVLDNEGRVIDGTLTPASARMLDELQRFSTLNIENRAVGARVPDQGGGRIAAVNMSGVEQTRKRLNALSQSATNDADRTAARMIIREYDNWLSDSFDNALFSGSDAALHSYRAARAANAEWRTRFGFNARDDADRIVNRIVTGEVTPQEASNWIVGAAQVGSKGVSSRLLTRIAEATGGDAEAMAAIRGGVWNRLSQATEGATAKAPEKVASGIYEFLNGSGRDVSRRLFTPEQQGFMRAYADTLRRGQEARELTAEVAKNTRPGTTEVGIGPMQELASAVVGRNGKSDEALFSAIDAYAKSGSRGDVETLSRIVRAVPERDKGDLAGAIIRQLGVSPRTGQFSPDVFASQWGTYTPQAKAILFGNAGAHRQALDDIMTISQRMKEVGNKFGNPPGTAQNKNFFDMVGPAGIGAWLWAEPYTAITSVVGGAVAAKILSSPAGASSAAKWSKAYELALTKPSAQTIGILNAASRNLANTAQPLGSSASPMDFMRAIQGPVQSRGEDKQR